MGERQDAAAGVGGTRLSLLDGFHLEMGGRRVNLAVSSQRLLAYLAVCGAASRPAVAGTLWPQGSEQHAGGCLRTAVWRLRRAGVDLVEAQSSRLALAGPVRVDVVELRVQARRLLRPGATATLQDLDTVRMAGGELLSGWYDDWVLFERERLRQLRMHALEALAACFTEQRRYAAALEAALEAVRVEPLRESGHREVIRVHLAEGNLIEALRHYESFRRLLADELGVEPSKQLAALVGMRGGPDLSVTLR
jgi:DNA-binding SARP family transcriptional activator